MRCSEFGDGLARAGLLTGDHLDRDRRVWVRSVNRLQRLGQQGGDTSPVRGWRQSPEVVWPVSIRCSERRGETARSRSRPRRRARHHTRVDPRSGRRRRTPPVPGGAPMIEITRPAWHQHAACRGVDRLSSSRSAGRMPPPPAGTAACKVSVACAAAGLDLPQRLDHGRTVRKPPRARTRRRSVGGRGPRGTPRRRTWRTEMHRAVGAGGHDSLQRG